MSGSTLTNSIVVSPVVGVPEISSSDDLPSVLAEAIRRSTGHLLPKDVVVVAQKIVSKAEGRLVRLDTIKPSARAAEFAARHDKDPRVVQVVLNESVRLLKMERGIIISETRHGFVCANAGVDTSNIQEGSVVLLPEDPDESARRIRDHLVKEFETDMAVIVSDTFGRPWREGLVNVAIGIAGISPLLDYRGQNDSYGRTLRATVISVADELASAAELVMKKSDGIPAALVRGLDYEPRVASNRELIRQQESDLFR